MSDSDLASKSERAARLAQRLLLSAKGDGLDDEQLASLGRRHGIDEKAAVALKMPLVALLVVGGLVTLGGGFIYSRGSADGDGSEARALVVHPRTSSRTMSGEPPAESWKAAVAPSAPVGLPATVAVALLPDASPPSSAPRARSEAASASTASSEDLSLEILALERVQHALRQHRLAEAKTSLLDYRRVFPKKLLGQEARVLEIEVLLAEGQREEGEARARDFLAGAGADGPYAARVRSLIARPRTP